MAVGVQKAWSTTASSNGSADTNVNFAEGQLAPTLNNSSRATMAAIKGWSNQISGGCTCAGSSNAYTITSDAAAAISTAYGAGMMFMLKANHTNTGAATLNVDSVGAVAIKTSDGGDVVAGDIVSGGLYLLAYNATGPRFDLIGTFAGGSFQPLDATLTAVAGLSFSSTNAFFRATDVDTFVAESASSFRTGLGLGTAALATIGTSGDTVPKNNTANTWSAAQTEANNVAWSVAETGGVVRAALKMDTSNNIEIGNANNNSEYIGFSHIFSGTDMTLGGVAVPTISSTSTFTNKTLSSPTLSGTVAGAHSYSGQVTFTAGATTIFNRASSPEYLIQLNDNGSTRGYIGANSSYVLSVKDSGGTDKLLVATGGDVIASSSGPTSVYSLGYRGTPQNIQNGNYTFVLADAGKQVHAFSGTPSWTIPPNSSVPYPLGTVIVLLSTGAVITLLEGSGVSLNRGDGTSGSGTRTVGNNSIAAITKSDTNTWIISGVFT